MALDLRKRKTVKSDSLKRDEATEMSSPLIKKIHLSEWLVSS